MKVLVVGLGSMGKRRIRCLQHHGIKSISGFDTSGVRREAAMLEYGIEVIASFSGADLKGFDAVIIATPPDQHHSVMGWAIDAAVPCFVEASVLREPLPHLLQRALRKDVLMAPSCTLRFHPAIREIGRASCRERVW